VITKQETDLILTRLACWTTNPAMKDHMMLPLLRDAQAHIAAMQRDINELTARADGKEIRAAMYHGEG
jgi:hypothetical protein